MDASTLAPWRDAAVVLLVIEAGLLALVPAVAFFFVLKAVRAVKRWIRMPLLRAQVWALRIQNSVMRSTTAIALVPITVQSNSTGIATTVTSLLRLLIRRRKKRTPVVQS